MTIDAFTDWPRDPLGSGRLVCASAHPMPNGAPGQWMHPESEGAGTCSEGCCDRYRCVACGMRFTVEAPD